jgi:hypothetical protein
LSAWPVIFVLVELTARQTVGSIIHGMLDLFLELPRYLIAAALLLLVLGAMIYAMVRVLFLFPLAVLACGLLAMSHVLWATGLADAASNPFLWMAIVGIVLSAVQLRRSISY